MQQNKKKKSKVLNTKGCCLVELERFWFCFFVLKFEWLLVGCKGFGFVFVFVLNSKLH